LKKFERKNRVSPKGRNPVFDSYKICFKSNTFANFDANGIFSHGYKKTRIFLFIRVFLYPWEGFGEGIEKT